MDGLTARGLIERSWAGPQVVAHRGASAQEPENTIAAFERAIRDGAPAIECDVRLTRDGWPVVMHDETLDRTTSLHGLVADTDWESLQAAGVPRLDQVVDVAAGRLVLVVELKAGDELELVVVDRLRERGVWEHSIVFAFDERRLQVVRRLDPELATVWLLDSTRAGAPAGETLARCRAIGADGIGVAYPQCTKALVAAAHAEMLPVFAWTVPPGPEVDRLRTLRANFIITNHPADVLAQLRP